MQEKLILNIVYSVSFISKYFTMLEYKEGKNWHRLPKIGPHIVKPSKWDNEQQN